MQLKKKKQAREAQKKAAAEAAAIIAKEKEKKSASAKRNVTPPVAPALTEAPPESSGLSTNQWISLLGIGVTIVTTYAKREDIKAFFKGKSVKVMNFFSDKEHPLVISSDNESSDSDKANEKSSKELDVDLVISPRGIKTEAVELSANESVRCITSALKRTQIKDEECEPKSVRSPQSKKAKRVLRFNADYKDDVDDDCSSECEDGVEFHNEDCRVPIFARKKTVLSPIETMKVLLNPDPAYICTKMPLRVQKNVTFIIHLGSLDSVGDVKCDNPEKPCEEEERKVILKREYYRINHDFYDDFRKRIDTFIEEDGRLGEYGIIQYSFTGEEHPIAPKPHTNAKTKGKVYVRTCESTMEKLKTLGSQHGPSAAFHSLIEEKGNLAEVRGLGELPKSTKQVSYLARRSLSTPNQGSSSSKKDAWYDLLLECKSQSRFQDTAFLREVKCAPEPACFLGNNHQINDIARFCTDPTEFQPLYVDATFNLGQFNVTIVSYKHLLLENRRDGKHPALVGPVLVHHKKTAQSYKYLCTNLTSLNPTTKNLLAFGTDDETALIQAFEETFDCAVHLLCERHMQNTLKSKFKTISVPSPYQAQFLRDVFGGTLDGDYVSGLVDCKELEEFECRRDELEEKWSEAGEPGKEAYRWFVRNKASKVFSCLGASAREQAGLGRPPARFTTNLSEGNNKVVQDFIHEDTRKSRVSEFEFVQSLQKLVQRQENDLEMAVIGQGPYRVREAFNHIITSPDDWVKMTSNQRKKALQKVHDTKISETRDSSLTQRPQPAESARNPVLDRLLQEGIDWIPLSTITGMTQKAEMILQDPGQVIPIPNSEGSILIPSMSDARNPHIVNAYSTGRIACNCANNKILSICSHAIVYAEHQKVQPKFYNWLKKLRRTQGSNAINFSNLVTADMPRGRGRKGERPPRRAKATTTQTSTVVTASTSTSQQKTQLNHQTLQQQQQQMQVHKQPHGAQAKLQQHVLWPQRQAAGPLLQAIDPWQLTPGPLQQAADPLQQAIDPWQLTPGPLQQAADPLQQAIDPWQLTPGPQQQVADPLQQAKDPWQLTPGPQQQVAGPRKDSWSTWQIEEVNRRAKLMRSQQVNQQPSVFSQPYHNRNPFLLEFRHGNIRKCAGCGGGNFKASCSSRKPNSKTHGTLSISNREPFTALPVHREEREAALLPHTYFVRHQPPSLLYTKYGGFDRDSEPAHRGAEVSSCDGYGHFFAINCRLLVVTLLC
ncbi:hypothetical protein ACROYT_G005056 [Oculina patagonica]